jgi:hypothetical protein
MTQSQAKYLASRFTATTTCPAHLVDIGTMNRPGTRWAVICSLFGREVVFSGFSEFDSLIHRLEEKGA